MVIATKFGFRVHDGKQQPGLNSRPEHIRAVAEAALKRLGTASIRVEIEHAAADIAIEGARYPEQMMAAVGL